jgi:lipopolysaccharide transport system permease protein
MPMSGIEIVLENGRAERHYWRDLWRYRELMYFLAWRDIAVRYKQTVIGVVWAVLKPALTMIVFVAFRRLAGLSGGPVPEAVLVLAGVLPWQFFSAALSDSAASLVGNANLISKVYFPRLIVPCAAVVTSLVDFLITMVFLAGVMAIYGFVPGWQMVVLPFFVLLTFGLSIGAGLLLAALNVKYRDFRHIVPFIVQFGLFISPVAFTSSSVPERWRTLYALNPVVGIIDGFRWSLLRGETPLDFGLLSVSLIVTGVLLVSGVWYFRRMERSFADVI